MGAWGFNILDDDTAMDVHGDYMRHFNAGRDRAEIVKLLEQQYPDTLEDPDEGPVFWIAIAKAQWDCGHLQESVREQVEGDVQKRRGLDRWEEQGPKALAKREAKLRAFVEKLGEANPRPRKPKAPIKRKPIFEAGDCVAVRLPDGMYGAMLVLAAGEPERGPDEETYGRNIVGMLRYKAAERPGMDVFERREWLRLTYRDWGKDGIWPRAKGEPLGHLMIANVPSLGFRPVKADFEVVGKTELRDEDPKTASWYMGWNLGKDVVMQDRWDRGERD